MRPRSRRAGLRARRGRTGSKYVTFRGGLRRAIPFLLVGSGVGRNRNSIWDKTVLPACVLRRQAGRVRPGPAWHPTPGQATDAAPAKIENPGGGTPGLSDRTIDGWGVSIVPGQQTASIADGPHLTSPPGRPGLWIVQEFGTWPRGARTCRRSSNNGNQNRDILLAFEKSAALSATLRPGIGIKG